jgi:hypothetical protein
MPAIPLTAPVAAGAAVTPTTPTASDTISVTLLGEAGCNLRVQTTGTLTNLTISDAGLTPAGNAPPASAVAMSATQIKVIYISPKRADLTTGLVTLTASGALTGVTYELYPA